jgi:hypothetical protein
MAETITTRQIAALFRKTLVMQMPDLEQRVGARSRRSLFRDLDALGYLSSYTHTGRYYTLRSIPDFDDDGLWRYQGIGFSRDGTLKATVLRFADTADAGRTQHELQLRLGVRVHNPLLDLVKGKKLVREAIAYEYVYVAAERARAKVQLDHRQVLMAAGAAHARPTVAIEVEVLLEVIHGARLKAVDAARVAERLAVRGVHANSGEVAAVLECHGLKKTQPSRWPRSKR